MIKWDLRVLRARAEAMNGTQITYRQIAEETGLSKSTINAIMNNQTRRVDFDTIEALLVFFSTATGHTWDLSDLIEYVP